MKKYVLPVLCGFAGMFVAHFIILSGFGIGIKVPLYFIAYPLVFPLISYLLTLRNPNWWLTNTVGVHLFPFAYWISLLYYDGDLDLGKALKFNDSSCLLVVLPVSFLIAVLFYLSLSVSQTKSKHIGE
jgi:hypothetical protein